MVICFIPGSGGHRYKRFLSGDKFDLPNTQMHTLTSEVEYNYRYLTSETANVGTIDTAKYATTHTMDSNLIRKFYPDHKIVKLKFPMDKSLEREWLVVKSLEVVNLPLVYRIDQAYNLIVWHKKYYQDNPIDYDCDCLIDIETDNTEFGKIMRRELDYKDPVFGCALKAFNKFSFNAPIIQIYKNIKINE